jgi:hypothetical protein
MGLFLSLGLSKATTCIGLRGLPVASSYHSGPSDPHWSSLRCPKPVEHMSGCCAVPSASLVWASKSRQPRPSHSHPRTSDASAGVHAGRHSPRAHLAFAAPAPHRRRRLPAREPLHLPLRLPPPPPVIAPATGESRNFSSVSTHARVRSDQPAGCRSLDLTAAW